MEKQLKEIWDFVQEQAEDEGLWGKAQYASEAYIQTALRNLHHKIETVCGEVTGPLKPKEKE